MELSERLRCLFSAPIEERDGTYVVEIPARELELGTLEDGETYRVAILSSQSSSSPSQSSSSPSQSSSSPASSSPDRASEPEREGSKPPVTPGDTREVEIETIGDQGDGITRVERGFVVIVPDTKKGERVRIEIEDVLETVAFAEVVERISYYD